VIGYSLFVKTGALHSPGTGEVACSASFYAPDSNVDVARVAFTDNAMVLPASVPYTAGAWYNVNVTLDMPHNSFDLKINGADKGTFQADLNGAGAYLPSVSSLALQSEHAGRDCWFDQVVTVIGTTAPPPPISNVEWKDGFET